jgi:DNA repair protein RadC
MKIIPRYTVRLVRSGCERYEARKIRTSVDAIEVCIQAVRGILEDSPNEQLLAISLDTQLKPIGITVVTTGTLDSSLVHPREVFRAAILQNAARIIIAHNHPSGDLDPSLHDIAVFERIRQAGSVLGIECIDSIIVGSNAATGEWLGVSMAERI